MTYYTNNMDSNKLNIEQICSKSRNNTRETIYHRSRNKEQYCYWGIVRSNPQISYYNTASAVS